MFKDKFTIILLLTVVLYVSAKPEPKPQAVVLYISEKPEPQAKPMPLEKLIFIKDHDQLSHLHRNHHQQPKHDDHTYGQEDHRGHGHKHGQFFILEENQNITHNNKRTYAPKHENGHKHGYFFKYTHGNKHTHAHTDDNNPEQGHEHNYDHFNKHGQEQRHRHQHMNGHDHNHGQLYKNTNGHKHIHPQHPHDQKLDLENIHQHSQIHRHPLKHEPEYKHGHDHKHVPENIHGHAHNHDKEHKHPQEHEHSHGYVHSRDNNHGQGQKHEHGHKQAHDHINKHGYKNVQESKPAVGQKHEQERKNSPQPQPEKEDLFQYYRIFKGPSLDTAPQESKTSGPQNPRFEGELEKVHGLQIKSKDEPILEQKAEPETRSNRQFQRDTGYNGYRENFEEGESHLNLKPAFKNEPLNTADGSWTSYKNKDFENLDLFDFMFG